jgi:hypothetical protein
VLADRSVFSDYQHHTTAARHSARRRLLLKRPLTSARRASAIAHGRARFLTSAPASLERPPFAPPSYELRPDRVVPENRGKRTACIVERKGRMSRKPCVNRRESSADPGAERFPGAASLRSPAVRRNQQFQRRNGWFRSSRFRSTVKKVGGHDEPAIE